MKKLIFLLLAGVMCFSLAGCNIAPKMGSGEQVISTSGDNKILLRDYLFALGSFKAQTETNYAQLGDFGTSDFLEYWNSPNVSGDGTMFDDLKLNTLGAVQDNALFYKLALENNMTYDQANIDAVKQQLDYVVTQMNSPEKTGERLFYEVYYVTPDEALESQKISDTAEAYKTSIREAITVTDEDVQAFYDDEANKTVIDGIQKVTVAHILINNDDTMTAEESDAAKAKADDILARALAGEDFGQMAAEYSEDGGSKDNNGEYTIDRNENFVPEFMDWTFAEEREPGDIDMVETDYGYHIMKLVSVQGYEDMKEDIRTNIIDTKYQAELDTIIAENMTEWELNTELYDSITVNYGQTANENAQTASEAPAASPAESEQASETPAEEAESSPSN